MAAGSAVETVEVVALVRLRPHIAAQLRLIARQKHRARRSEPTRKRARAGSLIEPVSNGCGVRHLKQNLTRRPPKTVPLPPAPLKKTRRPHTRPLTQKSVGLCVARGRLPQKLAPPLRPQPRLAQTRKRPVLSPQLAPLT